MRSSYSQQGPIAIGSWTKVLIIASPVVLPTELLRYSKSNYKVDHGGRVIVGITELFSHTRGINPRIDLIETDLT